MLINLLAESESGSNWTSYIWIIVLLVLLVAFFVWSFISQKKKQKAYTEQINAVKPGCKVKTIGGICGTVVSIDGEENTFVLKTGEEGSECYIKFDKQAIYQTDAKPEPAQEEAPKAEVKSEGAEEVFEESKEEENKPEDETK